MAEYPGLVIWTDAYLADTTHLSAEEHGVYLLLLMAAWRSPTCSLPDDDVRLSRMARVGIKRWKKIRPAMENLWTIDARGWTQKRLLEERERSDDFRSRQSDAGKASARKRKQTRLTVVENGGSTAENGGSTAKERQNEESMTYPLPEASAGKAKTLSPKSPSGATSKSSAGKDKSLKNIETGSTYVSTKRQPKSNPDTPIHSSPIGNTDTVSSDLSVRTSDQERKSKGGIGGIGSEAFDGPMPVAPTPKRGNGTRPPMSQQQADEYACSLLAPHVQGEWATVLAAEDPGDPNHDKAVTLCLKAAKAHGIGWVSPEKREERRK